jgi:hypothetical protein
MTSNGRTLGELSDVLRSEIRHVLPDGDQLIAERLRKRPVETDRRLGSDAALALELRRLGRAALFFGACVLVVVLLAALGVYH